MTTKPLIYRLDQCGHTLTILDHIRTFLGIIIIMIINFKGWSHCLEGFYNQIQSNLIRVR